MSATKKHKPKVKWMPLNFYIPLCLILRDCFSRAQTEKFCSEAQFDNDCYCTTSFDYIRYKVTTIKNTCVAVSTYQNRLRTWVSSRKACRIDGGDLIDLSDVFLDSEVVNLLDPSKFYWIGANDLERVGQFYWLDNSNAKIEKNHERLASFHKRDHLCMGYNKSIWKSAACSQTNHFICGKNIPQVTNLSGVNIATYPHLLDGMHYSPNSMFAISCRICGTVQEKDVIIQIKLELGEGHNVTEDGQLHPPTKDIQIIDKAFNEALDENKKCRRGFIKTIMLVLIGELDEGSLSCCALSICQTRPLTLKYAPYSTLDSDPSKDELVSGEISEYQCLQWVEFYQGLTVEILDNNVTIWKLHYNKIESKVSGEIPTWVNSVTKEHKDHSRWTYTFVDVKINFTADEYNGEISFACYIAKNVMTSQLKPTDTNISWITPRYHTDITPPKNLVLKINNFTKMESSIRVYECQLLLMTCEGHPGTNGTLHFGVNLRGVNYAWRSDVPMKLQLPQWVKLKSVTESQVTLDRLLTLNIEIQVVKDIEVTTFTCEMFNQRRRLKETWNVPLVFVGEVFPPRLTSVRTRERGGQLKFQVECTSRADSSLVQSWEFIDHLDQVFYWSVENGYFSWHGKLPDGLRFVGTQVTTQGKNCGIFITSKVNFTINLAHNHMAVTCYSVAVENSFKRFVSKLQVSSSVILPGNIARERQRSTSLMPISYWWAYTLIALLIAIPLVVVVVFHISWGLDEKQYRSTELSIDDVQMLRRKYRVAGPETWRSVGSSPSSDESFFSFQGPVQLKLKKVHGRTESATEDFSNESACGESFIL